MSSESRPDLLVAVADALLDAARTGRIPRNRRTTVTAVFDGTPDGPAVLVLGWTGDEYIGRVLRTVN